jgi:hypothetical protein
MRQPLAQIACDDALDVLIDFINTLLGAQAEPCSSEQAKTEGRQETERQRLADDTGDFSRLVNVAPDDQRITIRQLSSDRQDNGIAEIRSDSRGLNALRECIGLELCRHAREISCKPASLWIKQPGELNVPGILCKMIFDRDEPPLGRQAGNEVGLAQDHAVRARDQIVVNLPVDEAKEGDDEDREHGGHR